MRADTRAIRVAANSSCCPKHARMEGDPQSFVAKCHCPQWIAFVMQVSSSKTQVRVFKAALA